MQDAGPPLSRIHECRIQEARKLGHPFMKRPQEVTLSDIQRPLGRVIGEINNPLMRKLYIYLNSIISNF